MQLTQDLYADETLKNPLIFRNNISIEAFQEELLLFGTDLIDSYFENPNTRKVYAEIDLQSTRIPALKSYCIKSNEILNDFLSRCMIHGIAIGAFPPQLDVKINAQILYAILIGIDTCILYDLTLEPKLVWKAAILKLFTKKEHSQTCRNTVHNISNKKSIFSFNDSYLFTWYNMVTSAFLTAMDKPKESMLIMAFKAIIFPVVCLIGLPFFMDLYGVFLTATVSGALTRRKTFVLNLVLFLCAGFLTALFVMALGGGLTSNISDIMIWLTIITIVAIIYGLIFWCINLLIINKTKTL